MKSLSTFPLIIVATLLGSTLVFSDQIQPLLDIGEERQKTEQASQTKIDSMDDDTSLIVNAVSYTHLTLPTIYSV